jgi:DNA-binding MarR family transcriptional regulator
MGKKKHDIMMDPFTPCFDHLIARYGLITAAVYGKIWRYEQMRDKECWASKGRMAKELGVSWKTVKRHIDVLSKDGYIDTDGRKKGKRTFVYVTTGLLEKETWVNRLKNKKISGTRIVKTLTPEIAKGGTELSAKSLTNWEELAQSVQGDM